MCSCVADCSAKDCDSFEFMLCGIGIGEVVCERSIKPAAGQYCVIISFGTGMPSSFTGSSVNAAVMADGHTVFWNLTSLHGAGGQESSMRSMGIYSWPISIIPSQQRSVR